MVSWISLATALVGLLTALINVWFSREHRINDNERFAEVHNKIEKLNGHSTE